MEWLKVEFNSGSVDFFVKIRLNFSFGEETFKVWISCWKTLKYSLDILEDLMLLYVSLNFKQPHFLGSLKVQQGHFSCWSLASFLVLVIRPMRKIWKIQCQKKCGKSNLSIFWGFHDLDLYILKFKKKKKRFWWYFLYFYDAVLLRKLVVIFQFNLPIINSPHPLLSHFWSTFFSRLMSSEISLCVSYTVMIFSWYFWYLKIFEDFLKDYDMMILRDFWIWRFLGIFEKEEF